MISIDITMVIHIFNMIILMVVLNAVLYKPVLGVLKQRKDKLDSLSDDVEQFEENARLRQEEVDKKMREAGRKAKKALDGARSEAQEAGAVKLAAIRKEADEQKEKQLGELRTQIDATRKELADNVSGFSRDMAAKILGRGLEA
jgi:F-type H+-transporting ATPase subunit b